MSTVLFYYVFLFLLFTCLYGELTCTQTHFYYWCKRIKSKCESTRIYQINEFIIYQHIFKPHRLMLQSWLWLILHAAWTTKIHLQNTYCTYMYKYTDMHTYIREYVSSSQIQTCTRVGDVWPVCENAVRNPRLSGMRRWLTKLAQFFLCLSHLHTQNTHVCGHARACYICVSE